MKVNEIVKYLENIFPLYLQEDYDNSGIQTIFHEQDITNIYISLDLDEKIIDDAVKKRCNLILTHHPFLFKKINKIDNCDVKSSNIIKLIDGRISVYSMHTNLDRVYHKKLSQVLEMSYIKALIIKKNIEHDENLGFGSLSELKESQTLEQLIIHVKKNLNLDYCLYTGDLSMKIKKVGLLNGSGGNSIEKIIQKIDLDCIITGDVGYHNSKTALENGVAVIDAGHFGTEAIFLNFLHKDVQDFLTKYDENKSIKAIKSQIEKNPLGIYK